MNNVSLDLGLDPVSKCFKHYLLPSIICMSIKSLYVLADLMFIGKSIGSVGLAALNIVIPCFGFIIAISTAIGIGGSALMSIHLGAGNIKKANHYFHHSFAFTILIMLVIMIFVSMNMDNVCRWLGANDVLFPLAKDYLSMLNIFLVPYALGWCLSSFIRNDRNPQLIMYAMVFSALMNAFLDWLFLFYFDWGMKGAALATGLSQVFMMVIMLFHFRRKNKNLTFLFVFPKMHYLLPLIKNGLPTFIMEASLAFTILVYNIELIKLGGSSFVTAYSIALNFTWVVVLIIYGVGQAAQPIISFNQGSHQLDRVKESLIQALKLVVIISILITLFVFFFAKPIVYLFLKSPSPELVALCISALKIYSLAFLPLGINLTTTVLYQAIARPSYSTLVSLLRAFILPLISLFILPSLFDSSAVWYNFIFSELTTVLICFYILSIFWKTSLKNA